MKKFFYLILMLSFALALLFMTSCEEIEDETSSYYIVAEYTDGGVVEGTLTLDYLNDTQTEITELKFNLYPSAFREGAGVEVVPLQSEARAFPNGVNYGGIEIFSASENGEEIPFVISGEDDNILVLRLKNGVFPDERVNAEIKFKTVLAECKLRSGYYGDCVNLADFFPVLCARDNAGFYECEYSPVGDPFFSQVADYEVELTVPGEYSVAASGECTQTEVGEGKTTYTYKIPSARTAAFCLSKSFNVLRSQVEGVEITLYHEAFEYAEEVLRVAEEAVLTFEGKFGEYPFDSLTLAVTNLVQGGMEYSGIVFLSNTLDRDGAIYTAVHEIAHQWWYAAVGNNQVETAYIDEGLAEYSTVIFFENNPSYGITREGEIDGKNREFREFYGVYEQLSGKADTSMERELKEFSSEYEYVEICYTKSALMLDGIRTAAGDKRFFKALRELYERERFKIIDTHGFIAAFERAGCRAEGYINSFLNGEGVI